MSMKLSANFTLEELTYSEAAHKHVEATEFQIGMLKELCQNLLQPIRNKFGPVRITSGLRDLLVYRAMLKAGYEPSKTSDHFLVPSLYQHKGDWLVPTCAPNPRGKGAVDFYALGANIWDVYYWILDNFRPSRDFNQVIIYSKKYSNRGDFIHLSNPARLFIAKSIVPSKRPVMVYVKGNRRFKNDTYVSFNEFKKIMRKRFKE